MADFNRDDIASTNGLSLLVISTAAELEVREVEEQLGARLLERLLPKRSGGNAGNPVRSAVAWFALVDSRSGRREFGHGDLFLTRDEAEGALAQVLRDEPDLEPFLSVEVLPLPEPSPN